MAPQGRSIPSEAELDAMQWIADAPADDAVAAMLDLAGPEAREGLIGDLNEVIKRWAVNRDVDDWVPDASTPPAIAGPLRKFLAEARALPDWARPEDIARAERMFNDYGALSVTILFCASLPECYVVPDLASVLQATGQLTKRTEHRIRTTGAMIFPVMMKGGLTSPEGSGRAQILKVRLIHAMIRNLILRRRPEESFTTWRLDGGPEGAAAVPKLADVDQRAASMPHAFAVCGWNVPERGLPNNQEQLAYTLLTFSYVFLRSMRRLGIRFDGEEQASYFHAWNVAGHVLGVHPALMVHDIASARKLFARMQARGRADWKRRPEKEDPRPRLGNALMAAMKSVIPIEKYKPFPVLLTRRLVGHRNSHILGIDGHVPWYSRLAFVAAMAAVRVIDAVMRLFIRDFSISRLIARSIGYRLTCTLLMDETRPLEVPEKLNSGITNTIRGWGDDPKASPRMNAWEDRLTVGGDWKPLKREKAAAEP